MTKGADGGGRGKGVNVRSRNNTWPGLAWTGFPRGPENPLLSGVFDDSQAEIYLVVSHCGTI